MKSTKTLKAAQAIFLAVMVWGFSGTAQAGICWVRNDGDIRTSTESGYGWSLYGQLVSAGVAGASICDLDAQYYDSETNLCGGGGTSPDGCGFVPADPVTGEYPSDWIWFDTSKVAVNSGETASEYAIDKIVFKSPLDFDALALSNFVLIGNPSKYVSDKIDDTSGLLDYNNQLRNVTFTTDASDNVLASYDAGMVVLDFRSNFGKDDPADTVVFNTDGTTDAPSSTNINWDNFPIQCSATTTPVGLWGTVLLLPDNFVNRARNNSYALKKLIFENVPCLRDFGANYVCAGDLRADASNYIDPNNEAAGETIKLQNDSWCDALPNDNTIFPLPSSDMNLDNPKHWWPDLDGDGYGDETAGWTDGTWTFGDDTTAPEGYADNKDDCNDAEAEINPAAVEICDEIDNNCDGNIDEGLECNDIIYYDDLDEDGYGDDSTASTTAPTDGRPYVEVGGDCDDGMASTYPGAPEMCDSFDNDCDSSVDEDFTDLGDTCSVGTGECVNTGVMVCKSDRSATECDALPRMPNEEVCDDALDNDCDGTIDNGCPTTYYNDIDNDGYGDDSTASDTAPTDGTPYVEVGGDCDDGMASTYPGAPEMCDNVDNDCDDVVDEDFSVGASCTSGVGECANTGITVCTSDGSTTECSAAADAPTDEVCDDDLDNDCDTLTDEECPGTIYYDDLDGDGYGDDSTASTTIPSGNYSTTGGDCDDGDSAVNPAATEICDGIDNDCDSAIDEDLSLATEYCDGEDNNCNDSIDENCVNGETECTDGFDNDGNGLQDCDDPACDCSDLDGDGYSVADDDCNDNNASVHPGATEVCNLQGIDYDCDGSVNDDNICIMTGIDPNLSEGAGSGAMQADGGRLLNCSLTTASTAATGNMPKSASVILVGLFALMLSLRFKRREAFVKK